MTASLSPEAGLDTLEMLVARGADVNAGVQQPSTVDPELDDFGEFDDLDPETRDLLEKSRSQILESRALLRKRDEEVRSELMVAVRSASVEKLRRLIELGADPAFFTSDGYSPVVLAACGGRMDLIELLIAAGASADGASKHGESAVRLFSRTGEFIVVRRLLELGTDPEPLRWTGLHQAIAFSSSGVRETRMGKDTKIDKACQTAGFGPFPCASLSLRSVQVPREEGDERLLRASRSRPSWGSRVRRKGGRGR